MNRRNPNAATGSANTGHSRPRRVNSWSGPRSRAARWSAALGAALAFGCQGVEGPVLVAASDATAGGAGAGGAGPVPLSSDWQIQLSGPIDTSVEASLFIVDLEVEADAISALSATGRRVVCYFSAGSHETWRTDAGEFPQVALGTAVSGFPDERYVDIRAAAIVNVMDARLEQAVAVGCDGVQPGLVDIFLIDSGFAITRAEQEAYDTHLAQRSRELGLSVGLSANEAELVQALEPEFDWVIATGCVSGGSCAALEPFLSAGKPALVLEYGDAETAQTVCPAAAQAGVNALIKSTALDGFRVSCQ